MSDFSIAESIEAAGRVADRLGLGAIDPVPLHISDHVTLRLMSTPAVARIKPALAAATMRRELAVVAYLTEKGAPVVPALSGAHVEQGSVLSFWQWVPHQPADPESENHRRLAAESLHHVHHAFADYPGNLPSLEDKAEGCRALLREAPLPALGDADRRFLLKTAELLRSPMQEAVPIHGDAGLHNLFITESGALWSDFAAACRGPRGWDYAALGGNNVPLLSDLRSFCVSVWCWSQAEHPEKRETADYHLAILKRRFG
jgi:streptomycin 6-kinase